MIGPPLILHIITGLNQGGAEAMLTKLVTAMDRTRFRNMVVSLTGPGVHAAALAAAGIEVTSLGIARSCPDPRGLIRLIQLIHRCRPALVQTWLYHADLLGLCAAKLAGSPPVLANLRCSDMDFHRYSRSSAWVVRLLARLSRLPVGMVVNSAAGQAVHERLGFHPRAWHLIPNGFDLDLYRPDEALGSVLRAALGWPAQCLIVAHVARVDPMKDHASFLDATRIAVAQREDLRILLIGRGTEALALPAELVGKIKALGAREDVPTLLPAVDILCLSSVFGEGFPNVLGEAMSAGVPCISTDVGDAGAIIGDTGLVVPRADPPALAQAMLDLLGEGAMVRAARRRRARERIASHYSLSAVVGRYEMLYDSVLGRLS